MAKGQAPEHAFSEDDRKAALELAATVGVKPAAEHLGVARASIYRWIDMYPRYWSDLKAGDREAQRRNIAGQLENLADRYAAAEHDALDRAEELLPHTDAKGTAALIRAFAGGRGVAAAGARSMRDEDRERTEVTINVPQLERAMQALLNQADRPEPPVLVENVAEE